MGHSYWTSGTHFRWSCQPGSLRDGNELSSSTSASGTEWVGLALQRLLFTSVVVTLVLVGALARRVVAAIIMGDQMDDQTEDCDQYEDDDHDQCEDDGRLVGGRLGAANRFVCAMPYQWQGVVC